MPHIFWVLAFFLAVAGSGIWPWSYNEAISPLSDRVELWKLTASEALEKIQADEISVQEYAESLLKRIKARDEDVKAWAYLDEKRVMQEARLLDEIPKENRGPLHGLPIAVKDVIYTKDAASVRILRHAGALIFGKTTTTEFAAIHVGPKTHNPHDPLRTPGGSSSGSGAAVADFQAPMALGTQTGGSMIRPASFNGIYGFKPTWNSVSREGQKIYALMYDTLGWYGRCVEDLVLLADVFALQDDEDEDRSFQGIVGARFAICKTSIWPMAGPGTQDALARAADLLRSHGAEVHELELPSAFDDVPEWYRIGLHTEGRTSFLPEYRVGKDQLGQVLIEHVENSDNFTRKTQLMASDKLAAMRPVFDCIASQYAAIITPSVPDEAPVGLESTGSHVFCAMWSGLHVPVLNVPGFKGDHDMPIGLSLVAPRYRDRHLLEVGKAVGEIFEAEGGWETKIE
ncbi:Glutamyl-tRNA(Gln) amidotransferase subunit A [Fusarium oxysporum f. sp. raphani]|uniref:Glutamyl-tRNA(Gln) amidotransferase subunit A n=1 Tax=Fusarium oxysporum f. sp. raphani TaxID=96318 RepID=A0A8J5NUH4_FUSOX|nr:Glutamyl-tRNA(Gln) amidotransferase subunit A [Fusarium oxysporum f. sp. raphani]